MSTTRPVRPASQSLSAESTPGRGCRPPSDPTLAGRPLIRRSRDALEAALAEVSRSLSERVAFPHRCKGLPESMEICAFLIGRHKLVVPCESGRADLKRFCQELTELKPALVEHRMVRVAPQPRRAPQLYGSSPRAPVGQP